MARWEPPSEQVIEPPKPRRWPIVLLLLALLGVGVAGLWMIWRRRQPPTMDGLATATGVRSDLTVEGDSLSVAVGWQVAGSAGGMADSMRVEVGLGDGRESRTRVTPGDRRADTLRLRAPAPGETVAGYSCVAAVHGARLTRESCTPWQFVRPTAQPQKGPAPPAPPDTATKRATRPTAAAAAEIAQVVVQPDGQQVDPDIGGRCAAWQRRNPSRTVWLDVNQKAVPECMGPNGKPTVAQFCAFAVLTDGRRVKTATSSNDAYCERLYQAWVRERVA